MRASTALLRIEKSAMPRPWTPHWSIDHRLELARHAGLEDALVHVDRNADPVVEQRKGAPVPFPAGRQEDPLRVGVARVAQKLDDDVFDAADVVLGLPTFGFGDSKANVAVAEGLFDLEIGLARHGRDEVEEFIVGSHG